MNGKLMSTKGKQLDLFCWKCHKSDTNIRCNVCERSFHNKCISMTKNINDFGINWICGECQESSDIGHKSLDSLQLQQLLLMSLNMISKSADYYFRDETCFQSNDKRMKTKTNLIANAINLKRIENKINSFQYKSFKQMTTDFKWILHNSLVGGLDSGLIQNAKFLLSKAKSEQKDFDECVHCFINYYKTSKSHYYSWFSKPCPQLHQLVWAKVRGHPFWPSKVIKPNQQNHSVWVRFFGTHQKSWVLEKDCFLLSEEIPKPLVGSSKNMSGLLDAALEELKHHIQYLNTEYPNWFRYSPKMTPFSIDKMLITNNSHSIVENLNKNPEKSREKVNIIPKKTNLPNRPPGWKPSARKTFPLPLPKKRSSTETQTSEASNTSNPFEITFATSVSKNKKKSKTDQKLEIIPFEFQSTHLLSKQRTESNTTSKYQLRADSEISENNVQNVENSVSVIIANNSEMNKKRKTNSEWNINEINDPNGVKSRGVSKQINACNQKVVMNKTMKSLEMKVKLLERKLKSTESLQSRQILNVQKEADLVMEQMRQTLEADKQKAVIEERNKQKSINNKNSDDLKASFELKIKELNERHESELKCLQQKCEQQLNESKTKIWCFNCLKEAELYCCSHTYYCSIECQQIHWISHKKICTQK